MFSECRAYRWLLRREINRGKKIIIFIGLNPSKADSIQNDRTLSRIINFCFDWDYKTIYLINLFGLISKSPLQLKKSSDPIGMNNDLITFKVLDFWSRNVNCDLWLGWGDQGTLNGRNQKVLEMIKNISILNSKKTSVPKIPLSIGISKKGNPRHPLYMPNGSLLKPFEQ